VHTAPTSVQLNRMVRTLFTDSLSEDETFLKQHSLADPEDRIYSDLFQYISDKMSNDIYKSVIFME